eukprot:gene10876-2951_t
MSDVYESARVSTLKFKGKSDSFKMKKKKKAKRKHKEREDQENLRHGAWWYIRRPEDLSGNVIIESESGRYLIALDNGSISVSDTTEQSEGPDVQEIMTIIHVSENRIAIKTPFNRFLSVEQETGHVTGLKEAIGPLELWQPIFDDEENADFCHCPFPNLCFMGKVLLQGANKKLLEAEPGDKVKCSSTDGEGNTHFKIFSCAERKKPEKAIGEAYDIADGSALTETEAKMARRFQSWQDGKLRLSQKDIDELKKAKQQGQLHGALLERRAKMKSDRYCM